MDAALVGMVLRVINRRRRTCKENSLRCEESLQNHGFVMLLIFGAID
jgi:hypothetical protein